MAELFGSGVQGCRHGDAKNVVDAKDGSAQRRRDAFESPKTN